MCRSVWIRRPSTLSLAAAIGLVAAGFCGTAQAVQLWYDGFDLTEYTAGSPLDGQSGGTGTFFTGPWVAAGYPAVADNTKAYADNLDRPGLIQPSAGGSASRDFLSGCCTESRTSRLMDEPWAGFTNPDGTFYVSYLVNYGTGVTNDVQHRVFEMHEGGFDDGANRNLLLGFSSFVFGGQNDLRLSVKDSNTNTATVVPLMVNGDAVGLDDASVQGTHLMVLKFEMSNSGNDVVSAFLDPVGTTEPAANAVVSVGDFLADRMSALVQFSYNTTDTGRGSFDEIRVGTEFADVANNTLAYVGVPEPGTLTLGGLGIIGCVGMARRKRARV